MWAIVDEKGRHIGFIGLHEINWRNRWALGGLVIGDRSAWGKGYATDAVRVRTALRLWRARVAPIEGHTMNPAMKRVFEKAGYQLEGVARRKFSHNGRWHDAILYGLLAEEWLDTAT